MGTRTRHLSAACALLAAACASTPAQSGSAPPRPAPPLTAPAASVGGEAGPGSGAREASAARDGAVPDPTAGEAAAPERASDGTWPSAGGHVTGVSVARVGGESIDVAELLSLWMHRESNALAEMVETLVATRLALREAERLGIRLDPELVDEETRVGRRLIEEQLAAGGRPVSLEEYVEDGLGLDPERYLERLREDTRRQLLAERVVRAWTLGNEHAIVRVIVVPSERRLEAVREALGAGRDFADVASEFSIDPSARTGGLTTPLVRLEQSPLARLAFATPIGQVGGPLEQFGQYLMLEVEERPRPVLGTWPEVAGTIEASLAERPVEDGEYLQWKLALERRYGVDRSPLLKLTGESLVN